MKEPGRALERPTQSGPEGTVAQRMHDLEPAGPEPLSLSLSLGGGGAGGAPTGLGAKGDASVFFSKIIPTASHGQVLVILPYGRGERLEQGDQTRARSLCGPTERRRRENACPRAEEGAELLPGPVVAGKREGLTSLLTAVKTDGDPAVQTREETDRGLGANGGRPGKANPAQVRHHAGSEHPGRREWERGRWPRRTSIHRKRVASLDSLLTLAKFT